MSNTTIFAIYYAIGFAGAYLAWLIWVMAFEDYRRPTPRALIGMALVAFVAPSAWLAATLWGISYWSGRSRYALGISDWLSRPIGSSGTRYPKDGR